MPSQRQDPLHHRQLEAGQFTDCNGHGHGHGHVHGNDTDTDVDADADKDPERTRIIRFHVRLSFLVRFVRDCVKVSFRVWTRCLV